MSELYTEILWEQIRPKISIAQKKVRIESGFRAGWGMASCWSFSRAAMQINWIYLPWLLMLLIICMGQVCSWRNEVLWLQQTKALGLDLNGDPLSVPSPSSNRLGSWCFSPSEDSVTYPKAAGETSGRAGTHSYLMSYNATFSHWAPHFRRVARQHPTGETSLAQISHHPLALGKGMEPPGNEIAANTMFLARLSEPTEQDKRDSSPSSCLGRGVGKASLSMLMSHNYLLTAKTNGRNGESDTKSKMSQVIDSCHLPSPQPRLARETQW